MYGGSSTIAFVRSFTHGINELHGEFGNTQVEPDPKYQKLNPISGALRPCHRGDEEFRDFSRDKTDEYLHCFWEFVHPLFPVLHKPSFTEKYQQNWPRSENDENGKSMSIEEGIFIASLNLTFAIGCQFSTSLPPSERSSVAENYYQRSRKAFAYDVLDSISVSVVQMLLLSGVYLQSTRYASRCWNVVGLAIRVAQSLALHKDLSGQRHELQLASEMKRRIWHTCVILDK